MKESKYIIENLLNSALDNLQLLQDSYNAEILETSILSESSLIKEWLSKAEDEAWQDL
jgi:hypothetical protein